MSKNIQDKIYKILRWSQKYTKTDMVYLAKGGFWLSVGQVITAVAGILLAMAFANWLPKEIYGKYKYILSVIGLLNITTLSGINTSINRAIARGNEGSFWPGLKARIKFGIIGSFMALLIAGYYYFYQNIEYTIAFLLVASFLPFIDSLILYQAILIGKKKFKKLSQYRTIIEATSLATMIAAIYFTQNLLAILSSYLVAHVLLRLIFLKITLKNNPLNQKTEEGVLSYGKHLSFMNIIVMIGSQLDKILVYKYLGVVQLAIYAFATEIPEKVRTFLKNINILITPKFSQNYQNINKKDISKKISVFMLLLIPMVIIYMLAAPYIFKYLFPQYLEAVYYSQIYSLSLLSIPFATIGFSFLTANKDTKSLYYLNSYGSLIKITIMFLGIHFYGLLGLIISRVLYQIILSLLIYFRPYENAEKNHLENNK